MTNDALTKQRTSKQQDEFDGFDFSPEMIRREDGILGAYRAAAWQTFERLPYPRRDDEVWRRTELSGLKRDYQLPERNAYRDLPPVPEGILSPLDGDQPHGRILILPGGVQGNVDASSYQEGVIFTDFETAAQHHPDKLEKALGQIIKPEEGKFAALAAARAQNGIFVYIPKRVQVERPLHSVVWAAGEGLAHFSHLIIWLEEGASLSYVHELASPAGAGGQSLHAGLTEIHVGADASLEFIVSQSLGEGVNSFRHQRAEVARSGNIDWVFGATGSHLSKEFLDLSLAGESARGRVTGFYFGDGIQHLDLDTQQNHRAADTRSDLLVKGALKGRSHSVWRGMIYIAPGAQKTDGYQANPNLMLSDQAHADSIPGLEILADDVRCTHGATVGKIDPETLFYLRSRGISSVEAERLIVAGFFEPVLNRVRFDPLRARLKRAIGAKIEMRD